ncbi:hypothetical protein [Nocardia brasiliensis]
MSAEMGAARPLSPVTSTPMQAAKAGGVQRAINVDYNVEAGLVRLRARLGFGARPETPEERETREARVKYERALTPPVLNRPPSFTADAAARQLTEVAERIEGLIITPLRISSAISPEVALRMGDGSRGEQWALSWLPDRILTRRQALSAMVFDEILTDSRELDSDSMFLILGDLAEDLRLPLEEVLVRLSSVKEEGYSRCSRPRTPGSLLDAEAANSQAESAREAW